MTKKSTILLVEDEVAIRDMLQYALEQADFAVLTAETTQQAQRLLEQQLPELILLDWMLPKQSGIDYLKQLKATALTRNIPVVLLTARAEEEHKLQGFAAGADDYVTKPFSPRELIARIKSVLRRGVAITLATTLQADTLCLNIDTHQLTVDGLLVELTPTEYKLLRFFMRHPNKVYSRAQLLAQLSSLRGELTDRSIDVLIRRLRQRLRPYHYDYAIKTIRGAGYQWMVK